LLRIDRALGVVRRNRAEAAPGVASLGLAALAAIPLLGLLMSVSRDAKIERLRTMYKTGANHIYTTLRLKFGKIVTIGLRCIPAMSTLKVIAVSNICVKFINQLE
jgi:hypothetical protein